MKIVIKGEITVVAIIPIGLKVPNTFKETGAVITCAPEEADKEAETGFGNIFEYKRLKKLLVSKMPASAP